jgi:hypothetical protein
MTFLWFGGREQVKPTTTATANANSGRPGSNSVEMTFLWFWRKENKVNQQPLQQQMRTQAYDFFWSPEDQRRE